MLDDSLQSIVDQKGGEGEAQAKSNQGDDGHPFLPRIFLVQPRSLDLSLLDSPRVKVL